MNKPKEKKQETRKSKPQKNKLLEIKDTCINCGEYLALDQRYCQYCGGKRIYNKLTMRNLFDDFVDRFLNLENSFLKTFMAMFRKPEDVIGGYINGMRKKYLPAFSYFAIAITIAGFAAFILQRYFVDDIIEAQLRMSHGFYDDPDLQKIQGELGNSEMKGFMNWVTDYQSVIYFATIPLLAILSKIVFWNYRKYNFVEHLVIFLYGYSHISILSMLVSLLLMWNQALYQIFSFIMFPAMIFYLGYVLKRVFQLDGFQITLKTLLFFGVFFAMTLVIAVPLGFYMVKEVMSDEPSDNPLIKVMKRGAEASKLRAQERKRKQLEIDSLNTIKTQLLEIKDLSPDTINYEQALKLDSLDVLLKPIYENKPQ